jgi:predicted LPLAT superfamily acyltransferase
MDAPESRNPRELPSWMQKQERGNTFWLSIMSWLSLRLGRGLSRIVLYGIALYFAVFARDAGGASQAYLTRCLGRPAGWLDRYRHVLAFASTVHDRIYLLNDQFERFDISHVGTGQLHAEYDSGQGVLMFGAHLGSFEVLRAAARQNPHLHMTMAMYPENARQINQALAAINPRAVPDIIALGTLDAMLAVHRKLDEGALVGILADRASGPDQYLTLPFLGAPARFPTGPFRMAVMLKRPVYFMAGIYLGGNRYQVHFERLEQAPPGTPRDAAIAGLLGQYAAALERHCRAHPYNWFNFFDFWKQDSPDHA